MGMLAKRSSPSTGGTSGSATLVRTVTTTVAPACGHEAAAGMHSMATSTVDASIPYSSTTDASTTAAAVRADAASAACDTERAM